MNDTRIDVESSNCIMYGRCEIDPQVLKSESCLPETCVLYTKRSRSQLELSQNYEDDRNHSLH